MIKKITLGFLLFLFIANMAVFAQETSEKPTYLQAVISSDEAIEYKKSTIFDASQSFIPVPERNISYNWDFGDGNKSEGIEVLHAYKKTGKFTVTLTVNDGIEESVSHMDVFAYRKLIALITDREEAQDRITLIKDFAEEKGVYVKTIESFRSGTEFISEEVLAKKLTEHSIIFQKANQILFWTKENAGLNALSRYIQANLNSTPVNLSQKTITVVEDSIGRNISRIQRQFSLIKPKRIIVTKEAIIQPLIESQNDEEFLDIIEKGGYEYEIITESSGKLRPWNFMSYFVNILVNNGVPDNTIALLLLLPIIATVVAFTRQVIGITTFGIYTPSIITLSFLIIGIYAGLLTLASAIGIGAIMRILLKKVRMLFIPKMALVITVVSLFLFLILIASMSLDLFGPEFLSFAIFPMLILSTLVEKFVSVKTEKGLSSAAFLMLSTVFVATIAYFIAGGEIQLGFTTLKFAFIKNLMLSYPELVILLIFANFGLGRWSGLRILEKIRFREVFRHIEE